MMSRPDDGTAQMRAALYRVELLLGLTDDDEDNEEAMVRVADVRAALAGPPDTARSFDPAEVDLVEPFLARSRQTEAPWLPYNTAEDGDRIRRWLDQETPAVLVAAGVHLWRMGQSRARGLPWIFVLTPDGEKPVKPGRNLMRDPAGGFYPIRPLVFGIRWDEIHG